MQTPRCRAVLLLSLTALMCGYARAQSVNASFSGSVTDQSGAVFPTPWWNCDRSIPPFH